MSLRANNNNLNISIVVPVYNGSEYIDQCLHSLQESIDYLSDSKKETIEIIVCDNHSTDSTLDIVNDYQFDCAYRVIQTPEHYPNRTINWQYGLNESRGSWLMMLHADDLLTPKGLASLLSAINHCQNSNVVMISGQIRTFTDRFTPSRLRPFWPFPALISGGSVRQQILPFVCPFVPFTLMRRDAYLQTKGLNQDYELVQDWELWIRLLALGYLYYHPQEIGWWRNHEFSKKYAVTFAQEHFLLSQKLQILIPELSHATTRDAINTQLSKIKNWLPDDTEKYLDSILITKEKFSQLPSLHQAKQKLRMTYYFIGFQLYWLRILGSLRILQTKILSG